MPVPNPYTAAAVVTFALSAASVPARAQQPPCPDTTARATGEVLDPTGAAIPNATVTLDATTLHTGRDGRFSTACLPAGLHHATITADGFTSVILVLNPARPLTAHLKPFAETTVEATAETVGVSSDDVAGSKTLQASDLKQLADDPDEFARQLQILAASAGGAPGASSITVDGFQDSGTIPPKSAIAYIRVNPDLFSSEYETPPYEGGRVEIYTKPGQAKLHGALFTTQSTSSFNARDPFSTSKAAIGKQRYGFELSGPIRANKADFSAALEHREINNFAVVNALIPDSTGALSPILSNVPAPQSLWVGSARVGLLPTPKNNLTLSYSANVNGLQNLGVGGTTLAEAGFNSTQSSHAVRLSNLQTISANLLHETRLGYTWVYAADSPLSTTPSLQVAGAFTGGGSPVQATDTHQRDLEFDDDLLFSHGKHNLKAGVQLLDLALRDTLPTNFNGQYTFGGGSAPVLNGSAATSATTIISGAEQYRRTLLSLPGGAPTTFAITTGTPVVKVNQLRVALFVQDQWKLAPRLNLALGLRWAMQSAPETIGNAGPRLGLSWSPDRKQKFVIHVRSGLFFDAIRTPRILEDRRLDGLHQRQLLTYSPAFNGTQPATGGSATITTLRLPFSGPSQDPSLQSHLGLEYEAPHHFHLQANLYYARGWNQLRSENVNAPLPTATGLASPTGPRPGTPNTNLDAFLQNAYTKGNVMFFGLDQHSLKHVQLFVGYVRLDLRSDTDDGSTFPQSTYSEAGEFARMSKIATHQIFSFSNFTLPEKLNLSVQFNAASGLPYNITSGFDANGDGNFNDRPSFATSADHLSQTVYNTRFGSLVAVGTGTGTPLNRNAGTLPWNVHLDTNLSRSFALHHKPNTEGQTLALNLRSTNLLNHTNVTAVGSVLGSPFFAIPYAADPGRRVEIGLRWAF